MRVLHVHAQASFQGGVERILYDSAQGLAEGGWPQALYSFAPKGQAQDDFTQVFEQVLYADQDPALFEPDVLLMHKIDDGARIAELAARYPSVRMIHDHDLTCLRRHKYFPVSKRVCHDAVGKACYLHGCFIQRGSGLLPIRFKRVAKLQQLIQAHQGIRRFITISDWMVQELIDNGIDAQRIDKIHPIPAALANIQNLPQSPEPNILFVGQLLRGKGVDLMIRALAGLRGRWAATVVGDGHHRAECQALAEELGIGERVQFTGALPHEQLQQHYARARFSVVPSRWPEPFGMVGIEAMARSRPVVAFKVGGIPDWLEHQKNGFLVSEANIAAMTQAMQALLDDPALCRRLGDQAREHVKAHFSHRHYLEQLRASLGAAQVSSNQVSSNPGPSSDEGKSA